MPMGLSETDLFVRDENAALSSVPSVERPYLSDYLSFHSDIEPYPFVQLWAGIGSGKNTFIENMVNGCVEKHIPKRIVLLITSRKSKVLETLDAEQLDICNKLTNAGNKYDITFNTAYYPDNYRRTINHDGKSYEIIQRSVACTNAAIEKYQQYCYDPNDPVTHLWNRFDVIVWDEIHSLIMDSTYQSAPFHVMQLLRVSFKQMMKHPDQTRCKNIIVMTGTPECLEGVTFPKMTHLLALREQCREVIPKNIYFLDTVQAQRQLKQQLQAGERVIYFSNHVVYADELADTYGIPKAQIVVSFSDQERRKKLKKRCDEEDRKVKKTPKEKKSEENDYERMLNVESCLANTSRLRQDISLFFTTSKNKEGINIKDEDIHHVYIESHSLNDIKQMAGRIRNGAEHVYIITNSEGHKSRELYCEDLLNEWLCIDSKATEEKIETCRHLDAILEKFCQANGLYDLVGNPNSTVRAYDADHPQVGKFIDTTTKRLTYTQFDPLTNRYCFNEYHREARKWEDQERAQFEAGLSEPSKLAALFQNVFPKSTIHFPKSRLQQGIERMENFLQEHPENRFVLEEVEALSREIYLLINDKQLSQLESFPDKNRVFSKIGYQANRFNKNSKHANYHFFRIVPQPPKKNVA